MHLKGYPAYISPVKSASRSSDETPQDFTFVLQLSCTDWTSDCIKSTYCCKLFPSTPYRIPNLGHCTLGDSLVSPCSTAKSNSISVIGITNYYLISIGNSPVTTLFWWYTHHPPSTVHIAFAEALSWYAQFSAVLRTSPVLHSIRVIGRTFLLICRWKRRNSFGFFLEFHACIMFVTSNCVLMLWMQTIFAFKKWSVAIFCLWGPGSWALSPTLYLHGKESKASMHEAAIILLGSPVTPYLFPWE